jgi:uncharacterized protein YbjT (DUF2867 family)
MILIAGGTGTLGTMFVRRLRDRGAPVRVLTRQPSRAAHLAGPHVEIVSGDLRDAESLRRAAAGADVIVSAAHGFGNADDESPATVDRRGNFNLIDAASEVGAAVVLMSIVGAAPDSPMELFRAKHDAEEHLRKSGVRWSIVRATAFIETWAQVMGPPLRKTGRTIVFGRGNNPINFVSAADVAALLERVVLDPTLREQVIEIGGTTNLTFNQVAVLLEQQLGRSGGARHVPRPMLRAMGIALRGVKPALARHVRAAVVMDTHDMTFDSASTRHRFPEVSNTSLALALQTHFRDH